MTRSCLVVVVVACMIAVLAAHPAPANAQDDAFVTAQQRVLSLNRAGNYQQALEAAEQSLAIAEKTYGPYSAQAATATLSIAIQNQALAQLPAAEASYRKGLAIQAMLVTPNDLSLAPYLSGLGVLLYSQGRYEEADSYLRRSLDLHEAFARQSGNEIGLAAALYMLGSNYTSMMRLEEAQKLLERSLAVWERIEPQGGMQTATVLNNLGTTRQLANDIPGALDYQTRALKMFERFAPENLTALARTYNNLGFLARAAGQADQAKEHYRKAIAMFEQAFPNGHPDIATTLINQGALLLSLGQQKQAEAALKSALAMRQRWLPQDHREIALAHAEYADAWIKSGEWKRARAELETAANILIARASRQDSGRGGGRNDISTNAYLFGKFVKVAHRQNAGDVGPAFVMAQRAIESSAAASLAQMASRNAKGDTRLAGLARDRQDLVAAWQALDKQLVDAFSNPAARSEDTQAIRQRLAQMDTRIADLDREIAERFPEFSALANPAPLTVKEAAAELGPDEALVLLLDTPAHLSMPEETFTFVITRDKQRLLRSPLGWNGLSREVWTLRCGLDFAGAWQMQNSPCAGLTGTQYTADDDAKFRPLPFDTRPAFQIYRSLLAGAEDVIKGKQLLVVPSGTLTQLPLHVLVTRAPEQGATAPARTTPWLARSHAITILPSVSSLKALRRNAKPSAAPEPFVGFGNPLLQGDCGAMDVPDACPEDGDSVQTASLAPHRTRSVASQAGAARVVANGHADVAAIRALCPLPDTERELRCVAQSLGATSQSLRLGIEMTETALKQLQLDHYRVVQFATHGLLSGEMAQLGAQRPEPALVMTPPATPNEVDDGLLTASEIAGLKLDADWVVMSACNTAAAGADDSEALSGLARAFFYAGARALLVSHWPVESYAATVMTSRTFAELRKDARLGRAEAFRRAMLALADDQKRPWAAHPSVWAPFVVVGEGGLPQRQSRR